MELVVDYGFFFLLYYFLLITCFQHALFYADLLFAIHILSLFAHFGLANKGATCVRVSIFQFVMAEKLSCSEMQLICLKLCIEHMLSPCLNDRLEHLHVYSMASVRF